MKIMALGPITSWQIDGETMETVTDFILGGSKITADGNDSPEIKRRLLLGRKAMTNLDSILKSRDITLPINVYLVKAMAFPVVMYGCESWTIKIAGNEELKSLSFVKGFECKVRNMAFIPIIIEIHWRGSLFLSIPAAMWTKTIDNSEILSRKTIHDTIFEV